MLVYTLSFVLIGSIVLNAWLIYKASDFHIIIKSLHSKLLTSCGETTLFFIADNNDIKTVRAFCFMGDYYSFKNPEGRYVDKFSLYYEDSLLHNVQHILHEKNTFFAKDVTGQLYTLRKLEGTYYDDIELAKEALRFKVEEDLHKTTEDLENLLKKKHEL